MLNSVKDVIHTFGSGAGDVSRRFGHSSARVARRVGKRSRRIAHDLGPAKIAIGIAIAGVAIGGSILLVRYLRSRREEMPLEGDLEDLTGERRRSPRLSRAQRKAMHAHTQP